jgi:hypothetical protein
MFANMDRQRQCVFAIVIVVTNSSTMFNGNELEKGSSNSMDLGVGVQDVLTTM